MGQHNDVDRAAADSPTSDSSPALTSNEGQTSRREFMTRAAAVGGAMALGLGFTEPKGARAQTAQWPNQPADGRIHALPGINIYGSDSYGGSGRNTGGNVDIVLVTSLANTNTISAVSGLGANVYEGTLEGALKFDAGARAKQIILCRSGSPSIRKGIISVGSNWSLWGQFAPVPGFWPRGLRLSNGGNHWQLWHLPLYLGEDVFTPLPQEQDQGDALRMVGTATAAASKWICINCEFSRTTDELVDAFNGMDSGGFIYCAFLEAVGYTDANGIHRTQYGPLFGGAGARPARRLSIERSFFAHNTARNPWLTVGEAYLANNLGYNLGRLPSNGENVPGIGPQITNQFGFTQPMHFNVVRSMFVRGPNNTATISGVYVQLSQGQEFPVGSGVYIWGCVQHGWSNPASQSGFLISNASSNFQFQTTVRTGALPSGRLTGLGDTYRIAQNAAAPTAAEKQAFFDLIADSVGIMPSSRGTTYGRVQNALNQCQARLNGATGGASQLVRNSAEAGGWWTVPNVLVNPTNPVNPGQHDHWHAPLPTAASRHTPYTSGTFSNGASRVGYTPMEVWAIEQHWYRGGH